MKPFEDYSQELIEFSPDCIVASDLKGHVIAASPQIFEIFGLPKGTKIPGTKIMEWIHPEDVPLAGQRIQGLLKGPKAVVIGEYRAIKYDRSIFWAQFKASQYFDANGTLAGMVTVIRDITEMKQTALALEQSEQRYRELFETSRDAISYTDLQGRFLNCNRAFLDLLGYERFEEIQALRASDITAYEYRAIEEKIIAEQTKVRGYSDEYKIEYIKKSEERVSVGIRSWLRRDASGNPVGIWGITRDISAEKRLEEQLRQSEKMAAIGQLAGGVAQDFNNHLAVVQGYAELLVEQLKTEEYRFIAQRIAKASVQASAVVNKLLTFAKKTKPQSCPVDLRNLINEVILLVQHTVCKDIKIHQKLNAETHTIMGDYGELQNALLNLAINARDAMPEGGDLTFSTSLVDDFIRIQISDTGCGMSPETMEHLFEPFFTTKTQKNGTGMGLAAVYGITKAHQGKIEVRSQPGQGTTFELFLPVVSRPGANTEPKNGFTGAKQEPSGKILVIDSEASTREMIETLLCRAGYSVITVSDAQKAIESFGKSFAEIDLVILDTMVRGENGAEFYETLHHISSDVQVLFTSGYRLEGKALELCESRAAGFIQKPFQYSRLLEEVELTIQRSSKRTTAGI